MKEEKPLTPETFKSVAEYSDMAHRMAKDIMAKVQGNRISREEFDAFCITLSNMHTNLGKAFAREANFEFQQDTFH